MTPETLEQPVRYAVSQLVRREFQALVDACSSSRLTATDLEVVVQEYGGTFIQPPEDAYSQLDAVAIRDADIPTWSVRAPLWSREEGRSDLTLELTVAKEANQWRIELDDLHVP
jgi:hypothetical protein